MSASLSATPSQPSIRNPVTFLGDGFTPAATVTIEVVEEGFASEIVADAAGEFGSSDIADPAVTTLTVEDTFNAIADENVVIGANTYVWKADPGAVANQVKIGADAEESLANLKAAINLEANTGTPKKYGTATVVHPTVEAFEAGALTLKLRAKTHGTGGNTLASTTSMTKGSFPGATFNSGTPGSAATGIDTVKWIPQRPGTYHVKASDGTNEATCTVQVWTQLN